MNIHRALTIDGWMSEEELSWLAEQASKHQSIVEIGSWMGRSTRALADNTKGLVHAVDTWKGCQEGHWEIMAGKPESWLLDQFKQNMDGLTNVCIYQMLSIAAAEFLKGLRFDMIFIDGSHDYEDVKSDILAWRPLLAEGGLLCGHDYNHPPVKKAVDELLVNPKMGPGIDLWYAN